MGVSSGPCVGSPRSDVWRGIHLCGSERWLWVDYLDLKNLQSMAGAKGPPYALGWGPEDGEWWDGEMLGWETVQGREHLRLQYGDLGR
jgi:hypothetical protein